MNEDIERLEKQMRELRQELAEARRAATPEPITNYVFLDAHANQITLTGLFDGETDLIVVHSVGVASPHCTMWADGFNGVYSHLVRRTAFVAISADSPQTQQAFLRARDWQFKMVSCGKNTFAQDMGFEPQPGRVIPGVSAFQRKADNSIVRTGRASFRPGDEFCAAWHLLDLFPEGADGWKPQL